MINSDNLCMSCMKDIGDEKQCPYCGFHSDTVQISPYLPIRTVLGNRYLVGKLLSYSGDGATYMGLDLTTREPVNIREYFPDGIAQRNTGDLSVVPAEGKEAVFNDCRQAFADLWQKLRKFSGLSALIKVSDVLEGNGSIYAVTENIEGISLRDYLLRNNSGCLPWENARVLLMPVLSTLGTLHSSGIIHGGISPTSLIVAKDNKIRISDFSINGVRTAHGELKAKLFSGYAAYEQHANNERLGAWTDIYGFGAVLYRTLIGTDPIDVEERVTNDRLMIPGRFAEQLPAYVINGLVNALQIMPEDRTKTVEELRAELSASPVATVSGYETKPVQSAADYKNMAKHLEPDEPQYAQSVNTGTAKKSSRSKVIIVISVIIIILAAAFIALWRGGIIKLEPQTTAVDMSDAVEVPNFVNKDYNDVIDDPYFTKNFKFEKTEVFSAEVAEGIIIKQNVEVGTKVAKQSAIKLTVSKGKELIEFPASGVAGVKYDQANALLSKMGFKVEKVDKLNTGGQAAGTVSDASLSAGEKYEKGETVYLFVWSEEETTTTTEATTEDVSEEPSEASQEPEEDTPSAESEEGNDGSYDE